MLGCLGQRGHWDICDELECDPRVPTPPDSVPALTMRGFQDEQVGCLGQRGHWDILVGLVVEGSFVVSLSGWFGTWDSGDICDRLLCRFLLIGIDARLLGTAGTFATMRFIEFL